MYSATTHWFEKYNFLKYPDQSFLFFPSTGQMDCVWRNDSYLYNNVHSSEVLNMMCTEKAIICF